MTTRTIQLTPGRAYEIRQDGNRYAVVLTTAGKADYVAPGRFATATEAAHQAARWAQADIQQTAVLRAWQETER